MSLLKSRKECTVLIPPVSETGVRDGLLAGVLHIHPPTALHPHLSISSMPSRHLSQFPPSFFLFASIPSFHPSFCSASTPPPTFVPIPACCSVFLKQKLTMVLPLGLASQSPPSTPHPHTHTTNPEPAACLGFFTHFLEDFYKIQGKVKGCAQKEFHVCSFSIHLFYLKKKKGNRAKALAFV